MIAITHHASNRVPIAHSPVNHLLSSNTLEKNVSFLSKFLFENEVL